MDIVWTSCGHRVDIVWTACGYRVDMCGHRVLTVNSTTLSVAELGKVITSVTNVMVQRPLGIIGRQRGVVADIDSLRVAPPRHLV